MTREKEIQKTKLKLFFSLTGKYYTEISLLKDSFYVRSDKIILQMLKYTAK
jgi:hypothetical protein